MAKDGDTPVSQRSMTSAIGMLGSLGLEALLPLVRMIVLARLLPQDQVGLALMTLATIVMIEICCDLGLAQSAVRGASSTRCPTYMGTLHTLSLLRGAIMLVLTLGVLLGQWVLLDVPFGSELLVLVGLAIAVRSFENLSLKRHSRSYDFRREALLAGGTQLVWTVATIVAAVLSPSYTSLFWGMLAGAVFFAVASNLMSPERWRASWNPQTAREAVRFGMPLIPNGAASAVSNSDRVIVGNLVGAAAAGLYGVVISLATLPRSLLWRLMMSLLVPHFTNLTADQAKMRQHGLAWLLILAALAGLYSVLLVLLGPWLVQLAFGAAYRPSDLLMTLVAINVFIKLMLLAPTPIAFARGQTSLVLIGSVITAVAVLPAALMLAIGSRSIETFLIVLNIAEGLGLIWFLAYTTRLLGLAGSPAVYASLTPLIGIGVLALLR